jgi:transcription antitermination factor NusG
MLDIAADDARPHTLSDARGPPLASIAPCDSYIENSDLISSSSKFGADRVRACFELVHPRIGRSRHREVPAVPNDRGHGGARANSGGARENSGGARENSGGARENSGGERNGAGRPPNVVSPYTAPVDINRWYVIRTAFGQEVRADTAVRLDGFTVFNPSIFKKATPARRDAAGVMRPGKPDRVGPLLGRYFFVQLNLADPYWYQIKRLPGVDRVMSAADLESGGSGEPIAVPDIALAHIRSLLELNDCHYPDKLPKARAAEIERGVRLRITDGPMADPARTGICEASDGLEIRMTMVVMGHLVSITVAQAWVEIV